MALARRLGTEAIAGGLTWERSVIDPLPGARRLDELRDAEPLNAVVALARAETTGPGGVPFAESRVAGLLGEPTVLVDPNGGPAAVAAGLDGAAQRLGCDLVVALDVGGDALAHGDEPGLGSPLADAILLAAATRMATPTLGAIFGAGCDGELTPVEVADRLDEVTRAGGARGAYGPPPAALDLLERAVASVPTEASAQALACARGERGPVPIREGRRTVHRTAAGGLVHFFDPAAALASAARCAALVADARDLQEANRTLRGHGIATELDWEASRGTDPPG